MWKKAVEKIISKVPPSLKPSDLWTEIEHATEGAKAAEVAVKHAHAELAAASMSGDVALTNTLLGQLEGVKTTANHAAGKLVAELEKEDLSSGIDVGEKPAVGAAKVQKGRLFAAITELELLAAEVIAKLRGKD